MKQYKGNDEEEDIYDAVRSYRKTHPETNKHTDRVRKYFTFERLLIFGSFIVEWGIKSLLIMIGWNHFLSDHFSAPDIRYGHAWIILYIGWLICNTKNDDNGL